jgi:hypothetical protein
VAALFGLLATGCGQTPKPAANPQGGTPAPTPQAQEASTKTEPTPKTTVAAAPGWTWDLKAMEIPNAPVAGLIHGKPFKPDTVKLENGVLTLNQGQEPSPFVELKVLLFLQQGESAEGKKYEFPGQGFVGIIPQVQLVRRQPGQNAPQIDMYPEKYAIKLTFDKAEDNKLPGRIYLCLPKQSQGFVAGAFAAELPADYSKPPRPKDAPFLFGHIALKGRGKFQLDAGYVGENTRGEWQSNTAGLTVEAGADFGTWATSPTNGPRLTALAYEKSAGCTYQHTHVEPGRYLVYARWNEHYFDWRWVEVKDKAQLTLDFTIDPATAGKLELTLPEKAAGSKVSLIPLDADDKLPELKVPPEGLAAYMGSEVTAKERKVVIDGLRAGLYRVRVGKAQVDVQVKAGMTVTAEVPAASK